MPFSIINALSQSCAIYYSMTTRSKPQCASHSILTKKIPCPHSFKEGLASKTGQEIDSLIRGYDYCFNLTPRSKHCYFPKIFADFMPKPSDKASIFANNPLEQARLKEKKYHVLYSVYNKDFRYYTPAFMAGMELINYRSHPEEDYQKFRERVRDAESKSSEDASGEKIQIKIPKPTSSKCQVCHCEFEDYTEHIQSPNHKELAKRSIGNLFTMDLVQSYKVFERRTPTRKPRKSQSEIKEDVQMLINDVKMNGDRFKTKPISKQGSPKAKSVKMTAFVSATHATNT